MNNQQDDLTKLIARYLIVNLQGGGNPMYETDEMGVKSKGMDISGNVQATTNDLLGNAIATAEAPIHTAIDSQIFGTGNS